MKTERGYKSLRDSIRAFVDNELEPYAEEIDRTDKVPEIVWQKLRDKGLLSMTIPKQYGGMGLSLTEYFSILEEVSRTAGAVRIIVHQYNGISFRLIEKFGSKKQKDYYLPLMGQGTCVLAFALTEPDAGTGADIRMTATKKGNYFILSGKKHLITLADVAHSIVVFAVTDETRRSNGGITAFLVDPKSPGLAMENLPLCMGSRGLFEGLLTFEDCPVPSSNVLGEVGQGLHVALHSLDESRGSIAVTCLGLAQRFLELSVARAKQRVTFGKPLAQRQAIQQMLAEMALDIHALRLMCADMEAKFDAGLDIRAEASMCKAFGIRTIREVSDKALEIHGGIGYTKAYPIERMYRDARCTWLEEGTPTIQKLVIARDVLRRFS